jgi:glycosyltransferase involved in cell wall biosynthesis
MKVLHVVQGYFPAIGGTEHLIQRVSEELVSQFSDEVTVFTTNCYSSEAFSTPRTPHMAQGWEEINGVRVRRFPVSSYISRCFVYLAGNTSLPGSQYYRTLFNGPIIPGLASAIRHADYDIAVTASFPLLHMFTTLSAAHNSQRPCIMIGCLHPADAWGFDRPMIYRAIQQADGYVALTAHEANYVTSRGVSTKKITVIGAGTDLPLYEDVDQDTARRRLGIPEGVPVIGFIGQVSKRKGVETLICAMQQVWQIYPSARLLIAGAKTIYAERLAAKLAELPVSDREKILLQYNFPEEEKPLMIASLDILAYPSAYESFGISFIEAWALKKPVIGCRNGAVPFVIDAGRDGLLIQFDDANMLAEAIAVLLGNPSWARKLGQQGHQKVVSYYNWPELSRRYRQVYRQVLENYSKK